MIRVIKINDLKCEQCVEGTATEVVLCKNCGFNRTTTMWREKTLCTKLHAWVEPYEFCAWGEEASE